MTDKTIHDLTLKPNPARTDELELQEAGGGSSVHSTLESAVRAVPLGYDYIVDPSDANAAAQVVSAVSSLAVTGGQVKILGGFLDMVDLPITIPRGVQVIGSGCGQAQGNMSYSEARGTAIRWTAATSAGYAIGLVSDGSGLTDVSAWIMNNADIDGIVAGGLTGSPGILQFIKLQDVTVRGCIDMAYTSSADAVPNRWGITVNDFYNGTVGNLRTDVYCNGIKFTMPNATAHQGNSFVGNLETVVIAKNCTGILIGSREDDDTHDGGYDLSTFGRMTVVVNKNGLNGNTRQIADNTPGTIGIHLRGLWNCVFNLLDSEGPETLVKFSVSSAHSVRDNVFMGLALGLSGVNSGTGTIKTLDIPSICRYNTFLGGIIGVPAAYTSHPVQDDLTMLSSTPNTYLNVRCEGSYNPKWKHVPTGLDLVTRGCLNTQLDSGAGVVIPFWADKSGPSFGTGAVAAWSTSIGGVVAASPTNKLILGVARNPHVNSIDNVVYVQTNGVFTGTAGVAGVLVSSEGSVATGDALYVSSAFAGTVNNSANLSGPAASTFFGWAISSGGVGGTVKAIFGVPYRPT